MIARKIKKNCFLLILLLIIKFCLQFSKFCSHFFCRSLPKINAHEDEGVHQNPQYTGQHHFHPVPHDHDYCERVVINVSFHLFTKQYLTFINASFDLFTKHGRYLTVINVSFDLFTKHGRYLTFIHVSLTKHGRYLTFIDVSIDFLLSMGDI